jgi:hypothetical protein
MLTHLFAGLFHKRCPLCSEEVREQGYAAVQRVGKWFCSEQHADLYELNLYEALHMTYRRHAACHGGHVPLPEAVGMDLSPWHRRQLAHSEPHHQPCASTHD